MVEGWNGTTGTEPVARAIRAAGLALAAAVAAGCGGDAAGAAGGWVAAVDTLVDTVVVRTLAGSVWGDTARLVEELRIGAMEGEDAYLLGTPTSLAMAPSGGIYMMDAQVPTVRRYDPQGRHVRDVGREGAGPGEYRRPDAIAVLLDGRLLVRDPRNMRIDLYDDAGTSLGSWPHPNQGNFNTSRTFYVDTAGASWVTDLAEFGPPWEWEFQLIGLSPEGTVTDTVEVPDPVFERAQLKASGETGSSVRQVPFTADHAWSFSPFGYVVGGQTGEYAIYLYRPDQPVLRVEREAKPVPVVPEEAAERKERITRGLQRQYGAWRWNGPDVPDTKPPWRDLFVDHDGRIWVVASRPGEAVRTEAEAVAEEERTGTRPLRYREPPAFDLFDPQGRFLGPVAAPAGLRVEYPRPVVRGDQLWAVVDDEMGVPYLVRYRLVRGREGTS